jgi:3',5'-cyclic AMP phosphodiesterase CpdA
MWSRSLDQIQRIVQAAEDLAGHLILLRAAAVDDIPAHHHRLNALRERPDAVVVSGDIVNCGRPEEYQVARQILGIWRAT